MTLRARLLTTVLGLVAVALIVSDIVSTTALHNYLMNQLDRDLLESRAAAAQRVENDDPITPSDRQLLNDFFVEVRKPDGTIDTRIEPNVRASDDDTVPELDQAVISKNVGKGPFTVNAVGGHDFRYRVVALRTGQGDIIITAVSLHNLDNTMDRLMWTEIIVTVTVLFALGAAAWWIVRAELRQLDEMARTAGAIAGGDLSQRISAANPNTEIGRLGEALNTMLSQIEASFAEREASEDRLRRFAADASHELRTPLTAIRGYAELYRQGAIRDEDHLTRILHRIESEAARMGMMVDDLLLLARMDQNRPMESERVDLVGVLNDVTHDAQAVDENRAVGLTAPEGPLYVKGDAGRLHQVFANLVGNAMTHTPEGTSVHITLRAEQDRLAVDIKDNGQGLDERAAQRVFERFYRVDEGRSRDQGGTGLGLAIVKSIVESHGGKVTVSSTRGEGATFTVELPRVS
jgi:two-component system OmpR family sensor kinase